MKWRRRVKTRDRYYQIPFTKKERRTTTQPCCGHVFEIFEKVIDNTEIKK